MQKKETLTAEYNLLSQTFNFLLIEKIHRYQHCLNTPSNKTAVLNVLKKVLESSSEKLVPIENQSKAIPTDVVLAEYFWEWKNES